MVWHLTHKFPNTHIHTHTIQTALSRSETTQNHANSSLRNIYRSCSRIAHLLVEFAPRLASQALYAIYMENGTWYIMQIIFWARVQVDLYTLHALKLWFNNRKRAGITIKREFHLALSHNNCVRYHFLFLCVRSAVFAPRFVRQIDNIPSNTYDYAIKMIRLIRHKYSTCASGTHSDVSDVYDGWNAKCSGCFVCEYLSSVEKGSIRFVRFDCLFLFYLVIRIHKSWWGWGVPWILLNQDFSRKWFYFFWFGSIEIWIKITNWKVKFNKDTINYKINKPFEKIRSVISWRKISYEIWCSIQTAMSVVSTSKLNPSL